jgi:hypothetical protein
LADLTTCEVRFHTNDDDKDGNNHLTIKLVKADGTQEVEIDGGDFGAFGYFGNDTDNGPFDLNITSPFASTNVAGSQIVVHIDPQGNDTWKFGQRSVGQRMWVQ